MPLRWLLVALVLLGLSTLAAIVLGKFIAFGNRQLGNVVRWRRHGNVQCVYQGTITRLDDMHIVVEGNDGPVVIDCRDIIEVW